MNIFHKIHVIEVLVIYRYNIIFSGITDNIGFHVPLDYINSISYLYSVTVELQKMMFQK